MNVAEGPGEKPRSAILPADPPEEARKQTIREKREHGEEDPEPPHVLGGGDLEQRIDVDDHAGLREAGESLSSRNHDVADAIEGAALPGAQDAVHDVSFRIRSAARCASAITEREGLIPGALGNALESAMNTPGWVWSAKPSFTTDRAG